MYLKMNTVFLAMGFAMLGFNVAVPWLSYTLDQWMGVEMCKFTCLGRNHCVAVNYTETDGICEIIIHADIIKNQGTSTTIFTRKQLKGIKFQGDAQACCVVQCQNQQVCTANHNQSLVCVEPTHIKEVKKRKLEEPTHIKEEKKRKLERPYIRFAEYNSSTCKVQKDSVAITNHSRQNTSCLLYSVGDFRTDGYYYWTVSITLPRKAREGVLSHLKLGQLKSDVESGFTFLFERICQNGTVCKSNGNGINVTMFKYLTTDTIKCTYMVPLDRVQLGLCFDLARKSFIVVSPSKDMVLGSAQVPSSVNIRFKVEFSATSEASCKLLSGVSGLNEPPSSLLEALHL